MKLGSKLRGRVLCVRVLKTTRLQLRTSAGPQQLAADDPGAWLWFETSPPLINRENVSLYRLVEDESVISASSLSSLSAQAHDRDGDDFGVRAINQGRFPCLSATCSPLLSPIKDCLYLNNKALISVNYYSAGHCILSISLCFALPLSSSLLSLHHTVFSLYLLSWPSPLLVPLSLHWRESRDIGFLNTTQAILLYYFFHHTDAFILQISSIVSL